MQSMTGYGSASEKKGDHEVSVEIRSVNNRYLDIQINSPRAMNELENRLKKHITTKIKRGSVSVYIKLNSSGTGEEVLKLDEERTDAFFTILKKMKKKYRLAGEIDFSHMLSLKDIVYTETSTLEPSRIWKIVSPVLDKALLKLSSMRQKEGRAIKKDISGRIRKLRTSVKLIEKMAPEFRKKVYLKLNERINKLLEKTAVEESRIATEAAVLSEKADISEECTRFHSHLDQISETLKTDGETGKRINFLIQELNREANTICSKINSADISQRAVYLKEEIEKIREQIQNIE
ncbi:MAG: YicC/YloC family endoribonuclease [Fibrobacterota bacterium]